MTGGIPSNTSERNPNSAAFRNVQEVTASVVDSEDSDFQPVFFFENMGVMPPVIFTYEACYGGHPPDVI